jgi:hypothetical protein
MRREATKLRQEVRARREAARLPSARATGRAADSSAYPTDPVGYAQEVLGVRWWSKQQEVARSVVEHPWTFVQASHGVGKTHMAGGLVSWHFDSFSPSLTLTTAPTAAQVTGLTWKEVRLQRRGRGMLPKAARVEARFPDGGLDPGHLAAGYTANDADSFQGHHAEHLFILFEEATGIEAEFWEAAEGMLSSGPGNKWLVVCNPTDPSSPARLHQLASDRWHTITISALDHPNVAAQLRGLPKPFPKAIDLSWVEDKIQRWCVPVSPAEARSTDFCWPPADICAEQGVEPRWYRPGPLFEGRVLGRWPASGVGGVWSDALWLAAETAVIPVPPGAWPQVGCDPARQGDDDTAIAARRGPVALHLEAHNGWTLDQTAGRLKRLCREIVTELKREEPDWDIRPEDVPVCIDCDGLGVGLLDHAGEFNFAAVHGMSTPRDTQQFFNARSEMWFGPPGLARDGKLSLARLPRHTLNALKQEALSVQWKVNGAGQCQVERKEEMKKRLGHSPDKMDGLNLSYCLLPHNIFRKRDLDRLINRSIPSLFPGGVPVMRS